MLGFGRKLFLDFFFFFNIFDTIFILVKGYLSPIQNYKT